MNPSIRMEAPGPALLVVQTGFPGDVVLTPPLITALRQQVAPRRLAVLVRPEAAPLVADHPDVDDVLLDDKRGRDGGPFGLLRTARRLRREGFDLAVSPHRSLRTALLLAAARIPRRVGFRESRGALLYHTRVPRDRRRHDVERNLALLEPFGAPLPAAPRLHLAGDPDAAARAPAPLPTRPQPLLRLPPGSVWAPQRRAPTRLPAGAP